MLTYDATQPRTAKTNHHCIYRRDKHGVSHPLSGAVAYSNTLDRTTATLSLSATDAIYVNSTQQCVDNGNLVRAEYRN